MPKKVERVQIERSAAWREWLERYHEREEGIWLVTFKKRQQDKYISYDELAEEAICFGWIDSLPRKLDLDWTVLWMTPMTPVHEGRS